ncbi:uncharacterized protein LOC105204150 isoform X2 [Solenopsis invicta]|uniref:uncharacterized protein LOC105204150 isoform X2 n=1 Tax=Solenopsis invicta TaxID=13686 RepID=UPI00193EA042|nr:uncharacterized protein LOC105204150 isoform X2 [Solenopsis invicta]
MPSGNHMALGYGFCESATRSIQLVQCIKQWLNMIVKCGFKPVATVCDQGGPNVAAINMLIKEANEKQIKQHKIPENTFIVSNCEVVPLYDYVHLQKGVRNNLLTKDLVVDKFKKESERQFVSWNDIITVYEIDKYSFLKQRQMPKLTNKHIFPNCIPKMRVKYATQVISHTVANFIDVILTWNQDLVDTSKGQIVLSPNAAITADTLLFFDDLFDSFNRKERKSLSSIISSSSNHIAFWQNAVKKIRKMDFVEIGTHKYIRRNTKCLVNWVWTIRGAMNLWNKLQRNGFSSFNLRFINQDVVENCFSQIRDHGHRNNNPTPYQFVASFKTLVITNLTSKHSISANCIENNDGTSLSLLKMMSTSEITEEKDNEEINAYSECTQPCRFATKCYLHVDAQQIIKNVLTKCATQCEACVQNLQHDDISKTVHEALEIAELKIVNFCHEIEIKKKLKSFLYLESFSKFSTHCSILLDNLIEDTAAQYLLIWCRYINKIINGTEEHDYENNFVYNQAKRMSLKYKKKQRNKLFHLRNYLTTKPRKLLH